jgi:hypothetical protein
MINAPTPHKRSEALARRRSTNAGAGTDNDRLETTILMNDLAAEHDKLADRAAIKANGKKPPTKPSCARRAATYHDPRSDELTLSSIFRNKVAVPIPLFNYRQSS